MPKLSAGLLLFQRADTEFRVFLVHPGGPFWKNKDDGAWSIPKGEYGEGENPLAVAKREYQKELGSVPPAAGYRPLGDIRQAGGKVVRAWAVEGDFDPAHLKSNIFEIKWPPKSGKRVPFPEVDRGQWFSLAEAKVKILSSQRPLLERLQDLIAKG
jgi:predicted NUDIX family NTP pyrophosphohydrolase